MVRCGPCPGYNNLVPVVWLLKQAVELKTNESLTSQKALTQHVDKFEPAQKAIAELARALKAATEQTYQAKIDHEGLAIAADVARRKAHTKRAALQLAADATEAKKNRARDLDGT